MKKRIQLFRKFQLFRKIRSSLRVRVQSNDSGESAFEDDGSVSHEQYSEPAMLHLSDIRFQCVDISAGIRRR